MDAVVDTSRSDFGPRNAFKLLISGVGRVPVPSTIGVLSLAVITRPEAQRGRRKKASAYRGATEEYKERNQIALEAITRKKRAKKGKSCERYGSLSLGFARAWSS